MAKYKSFVHLQGTVGAVTFVENKESGRYVKRKRGTVKKAEVNDVLKDNTKNTNLLNKAGSPLLALLKLAAGGLHHGSLWANLLSRFRSTGKTDTPTLLRSLAGLPLHRDRPVGAVIFPVPLMQACSADRLVDVRVVFPEQPVCAVRRGVSHFRCTVSLLWTDGSRWVPGESAGTWLPCGERATVFPGVSAPAPAWATSYVALLKLEGGDGRTAADLMPFWAMEVLGWETVA
jgi:hypothetical protein